MTALNAMSHVYSGIVNTLWTIDCLRVANLTRHCFQEQTTACANSCNCEQAMTGLVFILDAAHFLHSYKLSEICFMDAFCRRRCSSSSSSSELWSSSDASYMTVHAYCMTVSFEHETRSWNLDAAAHLICHCIQQQGLDSASAAATLDGPSRIAGRL